VEISEIRGSFSIMFLVRAKPVRAEVCRQYGQLI
jgi:hypothetical protein